VSLTFPGTCAITRVSHCGSEVEAPMDDCERAVPDADDLLRSFVLPSRGNHTAEDGMVRLLVGIREQMDVF
jgi:hypothetical protein